MQRRGRAQLCASLAHRLEQCLLRRLELALPAAEKRSSVALAEFHPPVVAVHDRVYVRTIVQRGQPCKTHAMRECGPVRATPRKPKDDPGS
eukprot:1091597-Prymnesium_polylepis.1